MEPFTRVWVFFCVGYALLVFLTLHNCGVGLSPDSANYIAAARHLNMGDGCRSYDGLPLTVQPPLYPLLLALPQMIAGIDPLNALPFLNAVLAAGILALTAYLARPCVSNSVWGLLTILAVAANPAFWRFVSWRGANFCSSCFCC
ncbi:MAG: hypothetical protein NZ740_06550 [Kiritimatiellae bacterium]|nr:hypothetical protein [Kiritimatiellia bacterium]MDW8458756.1 hypothetical protein [Verrucomicrobiota bacterium]